ncbi:MAG: hypothetical protein WAT92_00165 [Saprospiraceae bacterium]
MIQANELRTGNIVKYAENVDRFAGKETKIVDIIIGETDIYEPILITEEWLLKFGFFRVMKKDNYITYSNGRKKISIYPDFAIMRNHNVSLKYIHQLQNLYYALTGKELILNKTNKE